MPVQASHTHRGICMHSKDKGTQVYLAAILACKVDGSAALRHA